MKISKWSGGITEELYIYPEDGDYSKSAFQGTVEKLKNFDSFLFNIDKSYFL